MPGSSLSYLVVSGGTGANSFATAFGPSPAFVLPVSDDGGSSAEILRCFGGPSIGDIRSRLIRLMTFTEHPSSDDESERAAIHALMAYRFPANAPERQVRDLWSEIVEGRSALWAGIGEDKKECIRSFLVHFQTLCLRRAHKRFSFRNFSLGNGFLTGARDLFGSLPSAIFLFKSIAGVDPRVAVVPVINTNQTVTIAAELENGETLVGQCAISHPTVSSGASVMGVPTPSPSPAPVTRVLGQVDARVAAQHGRRDSRTFDTDVLPSPVERQRSKLRDGLPDIVFPEDTEELEGNLSYTKGAEEVPLESPIERIYYINLYGQEIFPEPNPDFVAALSKRDVLVYSCGSVWTSIVPCLALRSLATAISTSPTLKAKVLLLNSVNDRETPDYRANDYIDVILRSLRRYDKPSKRALLNGFRHQGNARELLTHVVYLEGARVDVDVAAISDLGIQVICVPQLVHCASESEVPLFTVEAVEWAMSQVQASFDQ